MSILYIILILSAGAVIYDVSIGGVILNYSRSGLRAVGPFINPNNTGIVVALVGTALHHLTKNSLLNFIILALAILVLVLTGSKTALLIYAVGILFTIRRSEKVLLSVVFLTLLIFFTQPIVDFVNQFEIRQFSLESGQIRSSSFVKFLETVGTDGTLSLLFGFSNTSLVDNAYLDILGFGGLYLLLLFFLTQVFVFFLLITQNQYLMLVLLTQITCAMITTNIPRLWPTAYVYWAIVGVSFLVVFTKKSKACTTAKA